MSNSFYIKILATDKVLYEGMAVSLIFPAPDGEFQIMAHHENVVVACCEGSIKLKTDDDNDWYSAFIGIGFVSVEDGIVTMLVDYANWPDEVEEARAREAMERAKEQLRQDKSIQEYNLSRAALARAMVRLSQPVNAPLE
ncbi:MAG: ATP synthase F1 subunit epsilon [Lachnospiraceae bacterium]|jgi:F-type H+-transporting ATPase subunit epsilon|nr:ATP synthase F1 subunit epsilon [Lachnospiraceae bacterium]